MMAHWSRPVDGQAIMQNHALDMYYVKQAEQRGILLDLPLFQPSDMLWQCRLSLSYQIRAPRCRQPQKKTHE